MKVLVTGFDPFGGEPINPAFEALKSLPTSLKGAQIITLEVPTVAEKSIETVLHTIQQETPDVVIAVGQAGGRYGISLEKVAINLNCFRIPDNQGNQPNHTPVVEGGPNAYFSSLPIYTMEQHLKAKHIPAQVSYTAGTFVCNHLMYGILHYVEEQKLPIQAGFVHIPYMYEQLANKPNTPGMSLSTIVEGLTTLIETAITQNTTTADTPSVTGGTIC